MIHGDLQAFLLLYFSFCKTSKILLATEFVFSIFCRESKVQFFSAIALFLAKPSCSVPSVVWTKSILRNFINSPCISSSLSIPKAAKYSSCVSYVRVCVVCRSVQREFPRNPRWFVNTYFLILDASFPERFHAFSSFFRVFTHFSWNV